MPGGKHENWVPSMVSHKYLTDINGGDWLELKSLIYCVHTALQIHTLELRIGVGQGINVGPGKLLGQQSVIHQNGLTTKRIVLYCIFGGFFSFTTKKKCANYKIISLALQMCIHILPCGRPG